MGKMTLDGFNKFTDKKRSTFKDPRISIAKGGRLNFNKSAFRDYVKAYRHIELYYREDDRIIALKLLSEATDYSYDIKIPKSRNIGSVNCYGFFKHNNIDVSELRNTLIIEIDKENDIIFIKIK